MLVAPTRTRNRPRSRGRAPAHRNGDARSQIPGSRTKVSGLRYYSPSEGRFLGRDPRQDILGGQAWLVADLHARNFARGVDGGLHVIDLVAAPWPMEVAAREPLMADWLARVRENPHASVLCPSHDDEL